MDSSGNENSFIYYCSLSHYQIIVVMLDQDTPVSDLPHPDKAFPAINACYGLWLPAIPTGYATHYDWPKISTWKCVRESYRE